jgi:uncharacterized protein (DUF58 family)
VTRAALRATPRGIGLGIVTAALVLAAALLGMPELLGLAAAALLLLVLSWFLVSGGHLVRVTWLAGATGLRVERLSVTELGGQVVADAPHRRGLRLRAADGTVLPVIWGPRGPRADVAIPTRRRGPVTLGPWVAERVDPWGLFRRRVGEADAIDVLVTPRIRPVSLASLPSALADYGGSAEMGTTTFATLREYVVGDELRHVHWRSSAKAGTLMMRQYVDVTRPRITLVLVVATGAYLSDEEFEDAVDLIASLATVGAASGLDVDVMTSQGERAAHGPGRMSAAIDLLSAVQRAEHGPDPRVLRLPRATTLVVSGQLGGWWDRIPANSVMRP